MNRILLTIILLLPLTVQAQQDQSILFEIGFGFGTSTSTTSNACSNRSSDRPIFAAVRYRYDDVEVHGATWNGADCGRDAIAVGVGYVIDTQGDGLAGRDDVYASWTPGVSYVWQGDSTTSRLENNVNMFNRVAVGVSDDDIMVELAVNRYGRILKNYDTTGENFVTVGLGYQDLVNNLPTPVTAEAETATTTVSTTTPTTVPAKDGTGTGGNGNGTGNTGGTGTGGTGTGGNDKGGDGNGNGNGDGDGDGDGNGNDDPVVDDPYTPPGNGKNPGNKNDGKDGVIDGNAGSGNNPTAAGGIGKGHAADKANEKAGDKANEHASSTNDTAPVVIDPIADELGGIGKGNASDKGNEKGGEHANDNARQFIVIV